MRKAEFFSYVGGRIVQIEGKEKKIPPQPELRTVKEKGTRCDPTRVVFETAKITCFLILLADKTFELKHFYKKFKNRCSAILLNEARGSYAAGDEEIELNLDKNYWRLDYSCTPADNKLLNEKLETVKFKFSLERTDRSEERLCLVNDCGETVISVC